MINLFPKIQYNRYNRQSWGGLLFLLTVICIVFMIWTEIINASKGTTSLQVDLTIDSRIRVNLDATIQAPCQALSLNLQDMIGSYLQDVQHTIVKTPLIEEAALEEVKFKQNVNFTSCYGAELLVDQKCYSCQDVMIAFAQRRWRQPNYESIVQCVGQPTVQFDNSELQKFQKTDLNHQKQLKLAKNKLINITAAQLFKRSFEEENNDNANEILTQKKKDKYKKALNVLIGYNHPKHWDEQRVHEEINKVFDQWWFDLFNISLDRMVQGILADEVRFSESERVLAFQNLTKDVEFLTEIYRYQCKTTLQISLRATYGDESIIDYFDIKMDRGECSIPFYYSTNENIMIIEVQGLQLEWQLDTSVKKNQLVFDIQHLIRINEEYSYNYQPNQILDKSYYQVNITVQVNVKEIENKNTRLLFSHPFKVELPSQQYINVTDIVVHINESCRFFGYFYIKKVPGIFAINSNKEAMKYINNSFQGNHSFKLSFGEQPQTQTETNSQFSAKYYLKLVTTNSIDIWNNQNVYYTFTQQRSLQNATTTPFIEFQYEFDPISMTIQSTTMTNYLVLVFAVIGGVFAVSKFTAGFLIILI